MDAGPRARHRNGPLHEGLRAVYLCGVQVAVRCQYRDDARQLIAFLDRNFYLYKPLRDSGHRATMDVVRRLHRDPSRLALNPDRPPEVDPNQTNVLRLNSAWYQVEIDIRRAEAKLSLEDGFWRAAPPELREALLVTFLGLSRRFDVYGLHANAIRRGDGGALIIGKSGSGKTTLAVALIEEGWEFLSDDAVALKSADTAVEALAFRRGCSMTEATAARFLPGEWPGARSASKTDLDKRILDLHARWPRSFQPQCTPTILLFPAVTGGSRTKLTPIDQADALGRLIQESPGILCGGESSSRQLRALSALARQCRCYRVLSGTDVFERPSEVARLVEAA